GVAFAAAILQLFSGDSSAQLVAKYQPTKLAALEGVYKTEAGAPLILYGIVNTKEQRVDHAIEIPKLLSFLSFRDFNAEVKGLDQVPKEDWPNVAALFNVYRTMIGMWSLMFLLSVIGMYLWIKNRLIDHPWVL